MRVRRQAAFIRETRMALALLNRAEAAAMWVLGVAVPALAVLIRGNTARNVRGWSP